jgi:excisionase family DNA binding protein
MTAINAPDPSELPAMTVTAAAELIGISRSDFYRAIDRGEMPSVRIGRRLLVPTAKLYQLLGWLPDPTG